MSRKDKLEQMRTILKAISSEELKQGNSIIVADEGEEFRWFIEALSLMAKQVNLCEACITLLEKDMEQEGYVLARSQFNNMLWIKYLIEDPDRSHLDEFIAQPYVSQIFINERLKESLNHLDEEFKKKLKELLGRDPETALDEGIDRCKKEKDRLNVSDNKPKSILKLAKTNPDLFDMYITLYSEGSRFEHSDISTTKMYRKSILQEYDNDHAFSFELNTHNDEMWDRVFNFSHMCIFMSHDAIRGKITGSERHLIDGVGNIKGAFNEQGLKSIDMMFFSLLTK